MLMQFIGGATVMAYFVVGLFFLRFWFQEGDRLFVLFATAFWLMGIGRLAAALVDPFDEARTWPYLIRLAAFLIILAAVIDKNRLGRSKR